LGAFLGRLKSAAWPRSIPITSGSGSPPEDQPPSHYRLLGIPELESNPDVIDTAAERQTLLLRTFQTGDQAELAERLLNEVSAARICLLDGKAKARYDKRLEVYWPVSKSTQVFENVPVRCLLEVTENKAAFNVVPLPELRRKASSQEWRRDQYGRREQNG
jgi:curved DNA-binding protein CbpA